MGRKMSEESLCVGEYLCVRVKQWHTFGIKNFPTLAFTGKGLIERYWDFPCVTAFYHLTTRKYAHYCLYSHLLFVRVFVCFCGTVSVCTSISAVYLHLHDRHVFQSLTYCSWFYIYIFIFHYSVNNRTEIGRFLEGNFFISIAIFCLLSPQYIYIFIELFAMPKGKSVHTDP